MPFNNRIEGNSSGNVAEVDANNQLKVALPSGAVPGAVGLVGVASVVDSGSVTGTADIRSIRGSENHRLLVGTDGLLFNDAFNASAQNTALYRAPATTQTIGFAGDGYATLNSGSIVTANTNSALQTYRSFSVYGSFELRAVMSMLHNQTPQTNAVTEWGLFTATLPGGAIPTDGVFFRFTTTGTFVGVISYGGTETTTANLTVPSTNVNHQYMILIDEEHVEFWRDDVLQAEIATPVGQGQPVKAASQPFTFRHYIGATPPATAMQFKCSDVDIILGEINATRHWSHAAAGQGLMASQGQNGGTMGSTALYTNSLAPGAGAAMTNTTAALGSGLGGQFAALPTLAASTDGIMCSFQNPVGSTTQTPRQLVIQGINIQGMVTTLIAGGPILYFYSLAYGHTAVSMATAEAATTKAPRRIPLGMEAYPLAAALGTLGQGVQCFLPNPISIAPGEFIAICAKNVGVVSSAGVITWLVTFDGYWE